MGIGRIHLGYNEIYGDFAPVGQINPSINQLIKVSDFEFVQSFQQFTSNLCGLSHHSPGGRGSYHSYMVDHTTLCFVVLLGGLLNHECLQPEFERGKNGKKTQLMSLYLSEHGWKKRETGLNPRCEGYFLVISADVVKNQ